MLFLLFDLDGDRYALDAESIVEILPLRQAKSIPGTPAWIAGLVDLHGMPMPVIDVPQLALGRPAKQQRSTRLVVVRYDGADVNPGKSGDPALPLLGLVMEHATQTRRIERDRFGDSGVATPHARWLGPVASDGDGIVQWIDIRHILGDDVKALLFRDVESLPSPACSEPAE
jgi:chemotaxis-related protein WspB